MEFKQVYEYIEGKNNELSLVDPNHNIKNLIYHIQGGSYTGVMGSCIVGI